MTTYNYTLNSTAVITGALRIVGAIGQGETPTTDQQNEANQALNLLIKSWEADSGIPLWTVKKINFAYIAGQATYRTNVAPMSLAYRPLEVIQMYSHNTVSNADQPLIKVSRQEYNQLGNKTSQGFPNQFYYDLQRDYGELTFYPVPNTFSGTSLVAYAIVRIPIADTSLIAPDDVLDFPSEWVRALKYGLAGDLADEYGLNIRERQSIQAKAMEIKMETEEISMEDASVYFGVDNSIKMRN